MAPFGVVDFFLSSMFRAIFLVCLASTKPSPKPMKEVSFVRHRGIHSSKIWIECVGFNEETKIFRALHNDIVKASYVKIMPLTMSLECEWISKSPLPTNVSDTVNAPPPYTLDIDDSGGNNSCSLSDVAECSIILNKIHTPRNFYLIVIPFRRQETQGYLAIASTTPYKWTQTPFGLKNPKFQCLFKSVLQLIFSIFRNNSYTSPFNSSTEDTLLKCLLQTAHNACNSKDVDALKFQLIRHNTFYNSQNQEDSTECLLMLINVIHMGSMPDSSSTTSPTGASLSDILFSFVLEKYIVWDVCGLRSPSFESSSVVYISPTDTSSMQNLILEGLQQKLQKSCSRCNKNTRHVESSYILQPPKYLLLFVNRFRYINNNVTKDRCPIPMDTIVRLGPLKFSLQATIDHHGPSIHSGHYTASINCCKNNILLQRSHYYGITDKNSCTAYVISYKLIDTWFVDSHWHWHILSIPLTTGRGTSAESCGLDDVFPPDDIGSRPEALRLYIYVHSLYEFCYRTYIYTTGVSFNISCTPSRSIGLYFWGVRGSWAECHFLFSLVYQLCLALW